MMLQSLTDFRAFEKAIVAAIEKPDSLTDAEKQISNLLHVDSQEEIEEMPDSHLNDFAVSVRKSKKQRLDRKKTIMVSWVPPTSNICEQLVSVAKHVQTPERNRLLPRHLEAELFLKLNRRFWSVETIDNIFS